MIDNLVSCVKTYLKTGERNYLIDEGEIEFYNKNDTRDNAICITRFFLHLFTFQTPIFINY